MMIVCLIPEKNFIGKDVGNIKAVFSKNIRYIISVGGTEELSHAFKFCAGVVYDAHVVVGNRSEFSVDACAIVDREGPLLLLQDEFIRFTQLAFGLNSQFRR
jgi:hypothetical protein